MKPKSAINRLRPYTPIIKNPLLNSANSPSSNRIKYNSNDSLSNFNNNKLRYINDIENEKQSSLSKDLNAFLKVSQLSQRTEKRSHFKGNIYKSAESCNGCYVLNVRSGQP